MPWWKRRKSGSVAQGTAVGIAVEAGRIAFAARQGDVDGRARIVAWDASDATTDDARRAATRQFVEAHGLAGWPSRVMLASGDYSLHLVERPPNVPEEELADATRWLIRDLIEFDVESAEIAILTLPQDAARRRTPRMFVVAARHEAVQELAALVEAAGLDLAGFDIVESALLALDARMPETITASSLLQTGEKSSVLTLSHDRHLYLARSLHVDFGRTEQAIDLALAAGSPTDPEILDRIDSLLLDVQRSLDYYESEYGHAPASRLVLLPGALDLAPLAPALAEALRPLQVEPYECDRFFDFEAAPPSRLLPSVLLAVGCTVAGDEGLGRALLPKAQRARSEIAGLGTALRIAALVALAFCLHAGLSWLELRSDRQRLASLEAARDRALAELEADRVPSPDGARPDPGAELDALRARRDLDLALLRDVERRGAAAGTGAAFSTILTGLARQDVDGLWLTRIELDEAGAHVALEGRALEAEEIPRFLRRLGREPAFEDRRFRQLELLRSDDGAAGLALRLATTPAPDVLAGRSR